MQFNYLTMYKALPLETPVKSNLYLKPSFVSPLDEGEAGRKCLHPSVTASTKEWLESQNRPGPGLSSPLFTPSADSDLDLDEVDEVRVKSEPPTVPVTYCGTHVIIPSQPAHPFDYNPLSFVPFPGIHIHHRPDQPRPFRWQLCEFVKNFITFSLNQATFRIYAAAQKLDLTVHLLVDQTFPDGAIEALGAGQPPVPSQEYLQNPVLQWAPEESAIVESYEAARQRLLDIFTWTEAATRMNRSRHAGWQFEDYYAIIDLSSLGLDITPSDSSSSLPDVPAGDENDETIWEEVRPLAPSNEEAQPVMAYHADTAWTQDSANWASSNAAETDESDSELNSEAASEPGSDDYEPNPGKPERLLRSYSISKPSIIAKGALATDPSYHSSSLTSSESLPSSPSNPASPPASTASAMELGNTETMETEPQLAAPASRTEIVVTTPVIPEARNRLADFLRPIVSPLVAERARELVPSAVDNHFQGLLDGDFFVSSVDTSVEIALAEKWEYIIQRISEEVLPRLDKVMMHQETLERRLRDLDFALFETRHNTRWSQRTSDVRHDLSTLPIPHS